MTQKNPTALPAGDVSPGEQYSLIDTFEILGIDPAEAFDPELDDDRKYAVQAQVDGAKLIHAVLNGAPLPLTIDVTYCDLVHRWLAEHHIEWHYDKAQLLRETVYTDHELRRIKHEMTERQQQLFALEETYQYLMKLLHTKAK